MTGSLHRVRGGDRLPGRRYAPLMPAPRTQAAAWGLGTALLLITAAMTIPAALDWNVQVRSFPPLHAEWDPRVGWGTVPAILIAIAALRHATRFAQHASWQRLLIVSYLAGLGWMLALAYVDGNAGIGHILGTPYEYLRTARQTTDIPNTLREYVSRIPGSAGARHWPVHVAGHPPGALLFFVALVRLGLGGGFTAGLVVTLIAATTPLAVLVAVRQLGAGDLARGAAPFLVFGPAAVWQAVSADAMFAAVSAWGLAALALAAVRRSVGWACLAGLLLGSAVMLSYGLPLLSILALAVLWQARNWRPLAITGVCALAVILVFAAFGYAYWEALPVLRQRYFSGVASVRPPEYWMWGDFAALMLSAGPVAGAALAHLMSLRPWSRSTRVVAVLGIAAWLSVLTADLSQMSRAEVERIWLPFVPWLLLPTALLSPRWQRLGFAVQLLTALAVQHLLFTGW